MNLDSLRSAADLSPADRAVVDALPEGYETDATVSPPKPSIQIGVNPTFEPLAAK
jgi:hypothetical protein